MRSFFAAGLLWLACHGGVVAGESPPPATAGPDGQRAFSELAAFYADNAHEPGYKQAIADLSDRGRSAAAGTYLLALFRQLMQDEGNGRAPVKRTPAWGGAGATSDAREFRRVLAQAFAKDAQGDAAAEAAMWLINEELDAKNQPAGSTVLRRIVSPRSAELFAQLLKQPHPNAEVAQGIIEEAGKRGLRQLAPDITRLCCHYRTSVREAARAAAPLLGIARVPEYKPAEAFSPWLQQQLADAAAMVPTEIPATATWSRFTVGGSPPKAQEFSGWLLGEPDGRYRVVDQFGDEQLLAKADTRIAPRTLADEARALLAVRAPDPAETGPELPGNRLDALSRRGGLTGQFEPNFVAVPEVLVAAWCLARGDQASAAALLFPRIDATRDDRWILWVTRDLIGKTVQQRMLDAFSQERDYPLAIRLAGHLAKPIFDGYTYQARAKQLAAQLALRADDFTTFVLPAAGAWKTQSGTLTREQQIRFLAEHLRLLNCIQLSQPGDVSYADAQTAAPMGSAGGAGRRPTVINPFNELLAMKLEVKELPILVPFLADERFIPTYSYWRDFHPGRTLHQVNWVVAAVLQDAAKRDLAQLGVYSGLDEAGRKRHLEGILAWCREHAATPRDQLPDERRQKTGGWRIDAP